MDGRLIGRLSSSHHLTCRLSVTPRDGPAPVLKVTETMTPPERPSWVDDIDTSRIPLTLGGLF